MARAKFLAAVALVGVLLGSSANAPANAQEQQGLVDKARITVEAFTNQSDMAAMRRLLGKAHGVFVAPQLIKAGFIFGAEGGSGVLLARDPATGQWSPPAFYTMGAGSFGLQIGGEVSELVLVINTAKGLNAILQSQFKAGVDAAIAVGPLGKGVEASTTTAFNADIYAFSRSQGLYGGATLEGAAIVARHEWNEGYYGKAVEARDIVINRTVDHRASDALRKALQAAELK
jgi:lipid-binding SYLF domain-containing protein